MRKEASLKQTGATSATRRRWRPTASSRLTTNRTRCPPHESRPDAGCRLPC